MMLGETMISGEWVTAFVVAVIGAVGAAVAAYKKGQASGSAREVSLKEPVAEVPVRRTYTPPTFSQHQDVVRRVSQLETDVRDIRKEQADNFTKLLQVGEERKDRIFEKIDAVAVGFHSRVNQLVETMRGQSSNSKKS